MRTESGGLRDLPYALSCENSKDFSVFNYIILMDEVLFLILFCFKILLIHERHTKREAET